MTEGQGRVTLWGIEVFLAVTEEGAISAAAGVYYYIRPMIYMYMRDGHPAVTVDRRAAFAVAICAIVMIALGLGPSAVMSWAQDSMLAVAQ